MFRRLTAALAAFALLLLLAVPVAAGGWAEIVADGQTTTTDTPPTEGQPIDIGFVVLHRCGGGNFYFLGVQTWRGQNEVWETVYAKTGPTDPDFKLWTYKTAHRGTFCVWELGVVWHEKQAWVRFLNSSRGETDLQRYLDDRYEGLV